MLTREYLFDTLQEKIRAGYAEAVIDYVASLVFCEFDGSEEELKETGEKLLELFWNANEIVIASPNSIATPVRIEFDKHEFSNNFASWRDKTEKFVSELIRKNIRFKKLSDKGGFISTNGFEVYAR